MKKILQTTLTATSCLLFFLCSAQDTANRYKYFLGTNFDFIDGVEAEKLYHHVNVNVTDAFASKQGFIKRIGFISGLYQTRQVSNLDTISFSNRGNNLREPVAYPTGDPANLRIVLVDSALLNKSTTTKALGAYLQPTMLVGDASETNFYIMLHFEYTHRTITEKYTVSAKARDTLTISKSDLTRFQSIPPTQTIKRNQDEGYFGAGFILYHRNKLVELMIKGSAGAANLDKWRYYYAIDASLTILKGNFELGLSYKGLFPDYPPYFLNVHLTKVFPLDKIGELLK